MSEYKLNFTAEQINEALNKVISGEFSPVVLNLNDLGLAEVVFAHVNSGGGSTTVSGVPSALLESLQNATDVIIIASTGDTPDDITLHAHANFYGQAGHRVLGLSCVTAMHGDLIMVELIAGVYFDTFAFNGNVTIIVKVIRPE